MPIIENVDGVLRTHITEHTNTGGVLNNQSTVSVNDDGVIREVLSATMAAKIDGIKPLVTAEDHFVITANGVGTISLPAGARIILGSGGQDTEGGYVAAYTLPSAVKNAAFTAIVGATNNRVTNATQLIIGGVTYGCGSTKRVIQSKWGPIGGDGGVYDGVYGNYENATGAGGGYGGRYSKSGSSYQVGHFGVAGGNEGGYGNHGGRGGCFSKYSDSPWDGASGFAGSNTGADGYNDYHYTPGGGGGYAAGGGMGAWGSGSDDGEYSGDNGAPGAGIIVIEL